MRPFRDRPIRHKLTLVAVLTSSVSLLLACGALALYEVHSFRTGIVWEVSTLADVVGGNCTAALLFDDPKAARETLASLAATPGVNGAMLYTRAGQLFARYERPGHPANAPIGVAGVGHRFEGEHLFLWRGVFADGERVGSLLMVASTKPLRERLVQFGGVAVAILAGALGVGLVTATRTQGLISRPIRALSKAARRVSSERNYSIRVQKAGDDEVGLLTDAFNEMLAQIQARDASLEHAQAELKRHVSQLKAEISERRRTQEALEASEQQLRQAQKMEAIGQLAGGVAHDFNNLLTAIGGYGDLMLAHRNLPAEVRRWAEESKKASDRAAGLTRQLLAFSRRQILTPSVLNLNRAVADVEQMLRRVIGEHVEIHTNYASDLGWVKVDPVQVEQVCMNLIINARDAMPEGGRLIIETSNTELGDSYCSRYPEVRPGHYVCVAVSDTGSGMTPEVQSRIFDPFFTTKEQGHGTGLGLSTVYGIVKQSGGHIAVYSEAGRGSTFRVYLPRVDEVPEALAVSQTPGVATGGAETVLLVEDEDLVRDLTSETLKLAGYHVLEAANGQEALSLCDRFEGRIHLMLTDMVMPKLNGKQLFDRVVARRPDIKVLYMSGYTDTAIVSQGILKEGTAFIQKPFSPHDLTRKVRAVLDAEVPDRTRRADRRRLGELDWLAART